MLQSLALRVRVNYNALANCQSRYNPSPPSMKDARDHRTLARVVAFDTTSRNSNLDLIGFVHTWLDAHDVPYRLSFDPTGQKANLHATIGPVQLGGFALSGYVETVPTGGQTWTGHPFTLRRQDGRLIGRGTCDMKRFVAAALAAVPDIKGRKLARPVHLLLTYDEEVGYDCARRLVEELDESGLLPDTCLVDEASSMLPIFAAKGRQPPAGG